MPVIPIGMINTQFVPSRIPGSRPSAGPGIRIGKPLDFTAYAGAGNNRNVLRYVTDEIMNAVMELSGQTYVDAYGSSVKEALEEGRDFPASGCSAVRATASRRRSRRPRPRIPAPPIRRRMPRVAGALPAETAADLGGPAACRGEGVR